MINSKAAIAAIISIVFLAGCTTSQPQIVTRDNFIVVKPSESLYDCPAPPRPPRLTGLRDSDVARYTAQLFQNNGRCHNSVRAIRTFIENAERQNSPQRP